MFTRSLVMTLAVTLTFAGAASAADWFGDVSTDFATAANWSDYAAPNGTISIKAPAVGGVSNECTVTTPGNYGGAWYIVNDGVLNAMAPTYFSGGIAALQIGGTSSYVYVTNGTMNVYEAYASTVTNPNSVRTAGNLYVGYSSNACNGVLNVEPNARVTVKGVLTLAGNSRDAVGTLNLWGHIDSGGLRLSYNGGTYHINLFQGSYKNGILNPAELWSSGNQAGALNTGIVNGNIVSMVPGLVPVVDYNSVSDNTHLYLTRAYKATAPSPASGSTIQNMSTSRQIINLSWLKPLPEDVSQPVTSWIYMSSDPNMATDIVTLGTNTTASAVDVNVPKLGTYYWRVDSKDPNKAEPKTTTGDIWSFNTNNTAPVITLAAARLSNNATPNVVLWLPDNTSTTITANVVDDGYPLPTALTYNWERQGTDLNWTSFSTEATMTTPVYSAVTGTNSDSYNWRVTVSDGALSTVRTFSVIVYKSSCLAAPNVPGFTKPVGELSGDCRVNFSDMAVFVNNWLACNAAGSKCF
jgi:hypothetical protein